MNSGQNEDDRVQRLLSLTALAEAPQSSDHVDDDTLALLAGGKASAVELAAVRAHLVVCPLCRRVVAQVLSDAQGSVPHVRRENGWRPLRPSPALLAVAVAACLLLGATVVIWSLNRGTGAPRPGPSSVLLAELLPAFVSWERGGIRGIESEPSTISVKIDSPRDGVGVVVRVANGHWELLRGERPMKKGPGNEYGPIDSPPNSVVYIVVLSDRQDGGELYRTIRESLPSEPRDIEAFSEAWRDDVRARLTRGGHRWVSIEPIRVVPTKPDSAETHPGF